MLPKLTVMQGTAYVVRRLQTSTVLPGFHAAHFTPLLNTLVLVRSELWHSLHQPIYC